MSMKMIQQMQEDHLSIQDMKNKEEKDYDEKFSQLRDDLADLKERVEEKFDMILNFLINNKNTEYNVKIEDKYKTDEYIENTPTFIPDVDTSDMNIRTKEDEEEHLKDVDLEEGLEALDRLIK